MNKLVTLLFLFFFTFLNAQNKAENVEVSINSDQISIINENVYADCCAEFASEIKIKQDEIILFQSDTSNEDCRCECYFDLTYNLSNIPAGSYDLKIIRNELKENAKENGKLIHIERVSISTEPALANAFAYDFNQTECKELSSIKTEFKPIENVQVFPNTSNDIITLKFSLEETTDVSLQIYNLLGKAVISVDKNNLNPGNHTMTLNANFLQNGIFIGKLITSNGRMESFKLVWSE